MSSFIFVFWLALLLGQITFPFSVHRVHLVLLRICLHEKPFALERSNRTHCLATEPPHRWAWHMTSWHLSQSSFRRLQIPLGSSTGKCYLSSCQKEVSSVPFAVTPLIRWGSWKRRWEQKEILWLLMVSQGVSSIYEGKVLPAQAQRDRKDSNAYQSKCGVSRPSLGPLWSLSPHWEQTSGPHTRKQQFLVSSHWPAWVPLSMSPSSAFFLVVKLGW